MGMFANSVVKATPSAQGMYFLPGNYPVIEIDHIKKIISQSPTDLGTEKVIIVGNVYASDVAERPAGTKGVAQILSAKHVSSPGNYKAFLVAALGGSIDPNSLTEELIEMSYSAANPLGKRLIALTCYNKKTRQKHDFTVHKWDAISENNQATLKANIAAQGHI